MPDSDRIRRFDPPRPVEVWHDGAWRPATLEGWSWWPDRGEWMASVVYVVDHPWGRGKHIRSLPAEYVRPV